MTTTRRNYKPLKKEIEDDYRKWREISHAHGLAEST
jgi:hypothetical protein